MAKKAKAPAAENIDQLEARLADMKKAAASQPEKCLRGRPKGSKNKPKAQGSILQLNARMQSIGNPGAGDAQQLKGAQQTISIIGTQTLLIDFWGTEREAKYLRGNQQEEGASKAKYGLRCSVRLDVQRGAGYLRDYQQEDVDILMGDFQEGSVQEDVVMSDIKRSDREKIARRYLRKQRMNFANNRSRNLSKSSKAQRPPSIQQAETLMKYSEHSEHHGALPELSPTLDVSTENQREITYTWDTDSEKMDIGAIPAYARTTLQVDFHAIPWPMIPFPQNTEVWMTYSIWTPMKQRRNLSNTSNPWQAIWG
ncbi:hypothetical protein B0H14DRAFT_2647104 [Mycena olivaceomarginata]|nr:hypothetical protein B0H14DRAFT_2647104 [Mycena olivaceomarginata]